MARSADVASEGAAAAAAARFADVASEGAAAAAAEGCEDCEGCEGCTLTKLVLSRSELSVRCDCNPLNDKGVKFSPGS